MKRITIIGNGNVGSHMAKAFSGKSYNVTLFSPRDPEKKWNEINADLTLLCIPDDLIAPFSSYFENKSNSIVCHVSGSVNLDIFEGKFKNYGVFYPLQTFTKNRELEYHSIPFLLEANNKETMVSIKILASTISDQVHEINSEQRKNIHVAAVFANNFTNSMLSISEKILKKHKVDIEILKPLVQETVNKAFTVGPKAAQTGPAKRRDRKTLSKHESMLTPFHKEIYSLISKYIADEQDKDN